MTPFMRTIHVEVMKKVDDLISLIDQSSALGLPFGSHFFPNCAEPSTDALW